MDEDTYFYQFESRIGFVVKMESLGLNNRLFVVGDDGSSELIGSTTCSGYKPHVIRHRHETYGLFGENVADTSGSDSLSAAYLRALRFNIAGLTNVGSEEHLLPQLSVLISKENYTEYVSILQEIGRQAKPTQPNGSRRFVDLEQEPIRLRIDAWTVNLLKEIFSKGGILKEEEKKEKEDFLRGQIDFLFDSVTTQINARSLVTDIQKFFKGNPQTSQSSKQLICELAQKYNVNGNDVKILLDIVQPNQTDLSNVFKGIIHLSKSYGLGDKKIQLLSISFGYAVSALTGALSGYLRQSPGGIVLANASSRLSASIDHNTRNKTLAVLDPINRVIDERIADALLLAEWKDLDNHKFAEIYTTLERGKKAVASVYSTLLSQVLPPALMIGSSIAFMGGVHPVLGVLSCSSIPLILKHSGGITGKLQSIIGLEAAAEAAAAARIQSISASGEEVVTSPHVDEARSDLVKTLDDQNQHGRQKKSLMVDLQAGAMKLFFNSALTSSLAAYGLYLAGQIPAASAFASSALSQQVNNPLINLVANMSVLKAEFQDVIRMESLLASMPVNKNGQDSGYLPSMLNSHEIKITDLHYKGILKGIDLTIKPGQILTITGKSGSGKSTLLKCLLGLYSPIKGSITIGGVGLKDFKQRGDDSLRTLITGCNQSPVYLPEKTLKENLLLYSKHDNNDKRIKKVLRQLGLEKFADKLDTTLEKPSGGERLRFGLARAILRESKIIVLDEPTSALDEQSTDDFIALIKSLQTQYPDKTIICVTHSKQLKEAFGLENNFNLSNPS